MNQRMRGFTMVELLVTVALLGLLTALSVATVGPLRERYSRRQAAELAASAAARAQLMARETGRCHTLEVYRADPVNPAGEPLEVLNIDEEGDRLRIRRRKTPDCEIQPVPAAELEHVEWVRMPGRMRVRVPTGKTEPEWRPNSRLREVSTELRFRASATGPELAVRLMNQGPVCVSELPLEECP
ncbi:type II secretion system protein [Archangium sp.]|jgi:prepilin-type N-terminal cleavage/methylation domain-containing protein|uniref:pilus assembly FimT family protein n=1 Tax=Archangium sp. TaxID=1872627 RepID=UPI002ED7ED9A